MKLSPSDLEVLIHCRTSPEIHPRIDAPAVTDAMERFQEAGAVVFMGDDIFKTTFMGEAWLEAILKTPMPRLAWIDHNGKVIEGVTGTDREDC